MPVKTAGFLLIVNAVLCAVPVQAQAPVVAKDTAETDLNLDARWLMRMASVSAPVPAAGLRLADRSAYPAFMSAPAWSGVFYAVSPVFRPGDVLHMAVSEVTTLVAVLALKNGIRRPRPFVGLDGFVPAIPQERLNRLRDRDPYSFPSGHAALAAAVAASWSLAARRWYVTLPTAVWAAGVSVSRIWLGVHYPSDVLAGVALGLGTALAADWILHRLGSSENRDDSVQAYSAVLPLALVVTW